MAANDLGSVVAHYEASREQDRLVGGLAELDVRTREVLGRHLPPPPQRILDVGWNRRARDLAVAGRHRVHLVDVTPGHVERAEAALAGLGLTAQVGDARCLAVPDASFDAVLVLGPVYHLVEPPTAWRRSWRPVGSSGRAGWWRSRHQPVRIADRRARTGVPVRARVPRIVQRDLADGRHVNPDNRPHWFTTAFFHHPDELRQEITDAGLEVVELGVEGIAGWLPHLDARWRRTPTARPSSRRPG